ncbi:dephospho-CoA kinase [Marinospirillum insulare]|uniref:Dephospho-CoA kinase n=1 Tax=Marinospirillum insulare TaxID=217169 RepID=A0ABQ5ZUK1_9GAMM|nr:dephospho-CoA kinase [Marinospirillum insulare]GLR63131.1 dephospho-CoA kinase [Marinospirillum insulare]
MPNNLLNNKHKQLIIGLTGGIGSGKTAASDLFANLGIDVIDTDVLARKALELNSPLLSKVFNHFGQQLKLADGSLDRAALRSIIFNDSTAKVWLENLIHPWVKQAVLSALTKATSVYVLLASPLLIESGQVELADRLLIVDLPEEMQISRTASRDNNSPDLVKKIIAQQISRPERLALADDLIDNSGDLNHLEKQVNSLHTKYLELAKLKTNQE